MDPPDPPDHKSLLWALSQAGDWLRSLEQRHWEHLEPARRSLEDALGAVLQAEEQRWTLARVERARLQAEVTAIQGANEQAVQASVATIQALRHQLGSLHTRLLAAPEAAPPAEWAQEAATLLTRSTRLALKLTRAHFVPQPPAASLGDLQREEQVLCFPPPKSLARAGHPDRVTSQQGPAWAGGQGAPPDPGGACADLKAGTSEHPQGEELAVAAGRAPRGEEALPITEGSWAEERGIQRALPSHRNITTPSLIEKSPGRCLPTPETHQETGVREPGLTPAPVSAAAQGPLPDDPSTLFHARAVVVQAGGSESSGEKGGAGTWRRQVVLGSQALSARGPLSHWASAESLGRWWGAPCGVGTRLGGSCLELGPHKVERGSVASSNTPSARGALLGEAAPTCSLSQQKSSLCHREIPGLPPSLTAPPLPCNQLVGQWGTQGSQHGQLCLPHGLHATPAGPLYVVDFGNRRLQEVGSTSRLLPLRGKAYFDVTVGRGGCLALTNSTWHCVELYNARGLLLQAMSEGFGSPRGIAASPQGEFLVADMRLGVMHILVASSGPGGHLVRCRTVAGFHKPYLVATNSHGEVAVSERGLDGGCCVKVLGANWQLLRVLGGHSSPPILTNPWGVSLDEAGRVLVADWGRHAHTVLCYPLQGRGWAVVTEGLSSPRGVALLGKRHLVVADSMHHCLKTFLYC